jgi:hypothetical protein
VKAHLEWVQSVAEIRQNIREFHRDLQFHTQRAKLIAGKQHFWAYDPMSKRFGPSKFVGYRGMTYTTYNSIHRGEGNDGVPFQGTNAMQRIERVTGSSFAFDSKLEAGLLAWMKRTFGATAMKRWAPKWMYLTLPSITKNDGRPDPAEGASNKKVEKFLRGQGFGLKKPEIDAIDARAMRVAYKLFKKRGYDMQNHSKTHSYDWLATKGGEELYVEVKGTTGPGETFFLTQKEEEMSRLDPDKMALVFVREIVLHKGDKPTATGGVPQLVRPWDVTEYRAVPIHFECRVPKSEGH